MFLFQIHEYYTLNSKQTKDTVDTDTIQLLAEPKHMFSLLRQNILLHNDNKFIFAVLN